MKIPPRPFGIVETASRRKRDYITISGFEDALEKFGSFLEENQHFPFSASDEYECSLRRWYQEVRQGIIQLTPAQHQSLEVLVEKYKDLPHVRSRK